MMVDFNSGKIQYWDTGWISVHNIVPLFSSLPSHRFSKDSSRSQPPAAKRRIPAGRNPWWRGSGPHSSQSHGFVHLLLLVRRPVVLPAVNPTQEAAFAQRRSEITPLEQNPLLKRAYLCIVEASEVLQHRRGTFQISCSDATNLTPHPQRFPSRRTETLLITVMQI